MALRGGCGCCHVTLRTWIHFTEVISESGVQMLGMPSLLHVTSAVPQLMGGCCVLSVMENCGKRRGWWKG